MADSEDWIDIGSADELSKQPLQQVRVNNRDFAVSFQDGQFGVIANGCNPRRRSAGRRPSRR